MYFKALTTTMLLASAGLSVGLPAAANGALRPAVEPTTTLPNLRLNQPFAGEGYNPVPARDPYNYNNVNTCGEDNGGRMCDHQTPGGGSCCSRYGYCGETDEYCGRGCQVGFSLGTCHHEEHEHHETNHCGPNHGNKECDDGYCCGNDGKCGKGHCDGKVSPLPAPEKLKEERCGPKHHDHKCSNNQCCSRAGYCGVGKDFCSVPENCQRTFGWCDSEAKPAGPVTNDDLRSPKGKIDSDTTIMKCKKPMTIAMTFDDGPSENTQQLLDILGHHGAKATFFISGNTNGKGPIDQVDKWVQAIRRMDAEGHQLGSHTWDHSHMDKISSNARREELLKNERAMANVVGKYPTYMRSPYVECGEECMADMKALGYHVVGWEVDSTDWQNEKDLGAMTRVVDAAFDKAPADGNMLLIQHDTLPVSALELTKLVLKRVEEKGWKAVTLSECLGEPKELNHRYPDVFDASIISHGGCAVSSGAGCLELESFYDKVTCFSTLQGCVKQLDSSVWQVQQASLDYAKAKAVCDKLYYFCAQCGEDSVGKASKCETKSFHFPQW